MNPDVNKPPTCFNVYNPDTILASLAALGLRPVDKRKSAPALGAPVPCFIEKIKTFSYNKKDLAWGIESNAMCVTAITKYWIYY